MKKICTIVFAVSATLSFFAINVRAAETVTNQANFGEYQDWRLLSVSHRLDKNTLRALLGNDTAITAARSGKTLPWPDGAILANVIFSEKKHPNWPQAIVPDAFTKTDVMVKDSKKYAETGGWGFGSWQGKNLQILDKSKAAECFACHTAVKNNDYVFTTPALK